MKPFYHDPTGNKIYNGDALTVLKTLPDESVQMCMTSPPYWGLRNYAGGEDIIWGGDEKCEHRWGVESKKVRHSKIWASSSPIESRPPEEQISVSRGQFCQFCNCWRGQLGLEPTPELYVEHLMIIFREIKRVLRKDGSFYLNIGDTYWGGKGQSGYELPHECVERHERGETLQKPYQVPGYMNMRPQDGKHPILQPKCMTCIPERVMFAMLKAGWILRNKIIWHKPNSMPGSQKDRFSCSWEYLYFFTKARKYYFDLDAVRIPHTTESLERYQRGVNLDRPAIGKSAEVGPMQQYKRSPQWFQEMFPPDQDYKGKFDDLFGHGPQTQSFNLRVRDVKRGKKGVSAQGGELTASEREIEEYDYPEKHHGSSMTNQESLHREGQKHESADLGAQSPARKRHSGYFGEDGQPLVDFAKGKNPGDVFQSKREPYLINNPHTMRLRKDQYIALNPEHPDDLSHPKGKNPGDYWDITTQPSSICVCPKCEAVFPRYTKVCPSCRIEGVVGHFAPYPVALCEMPIKASTKVGDVVLDPLAGGGNTGVAAKALGRKCILIDCVKEYCIMARFKLSRIEYQPELGWT